MKTQKEIQTEIKAKFKTRTEEELKNDITVLFSSIEKNENIILLSYAMQILTDKIGEEQADLFIDEIFNAL